MAATSIALLPMMSFAKAKPIMTTDLLQHLKKGEPWDRGVLTSKKMVMFQQAAISGGTDAISVSKITLAYFTSSDCSGAKANNSFYTTPDSTSDNPPFSISVDTPFGLVAASAWNVGRTKLSIADMTTIQSIAVTLKSTNSNTPQAAFTNGDGKVISYACIPVRCASGQCESTTGDLQRFTLKTTAAVGDPADGGVIGCQNTGVSFNLFNIVVTTSDQSTGQIWGSLVDTGATSTTDGAGNTSKIVTTPGIGSTYAARTCSGLSVKGGFTSGWFLPSGGNTNTQLNCLYRNRDAIATGSVAAGGAGLSTAVGTYYWSSTQNNTNFAWEVLFSSGSPGSISKGSSMRVRCSRAF